MKFILSILALSLSMSAFAFKLPVGSFDALSVKSIASFPAEEAPIFEGIVKLSNCSGSLVILDGMSTSSKALVLTNGHCLGGGGFLKPGEVVTNRATSRSMKVYDAQMKLHKINAVKVIYATMTNTDVTLYELDQTYAQIQASSAVRPLLLASTRPLAPTKIDIPSGYWDRNWSCEIDGFVFALREGDWTFTDSIRYDKGCDTIGGTSGSPIVEHGTRTQIGINNTSNEDGQRCTLNNPCEVDQAGRVVIVNKRSYGQQTFNFYGCMDAQFKLDLNLSSCELPKP
ncbi:MAG: serine protease [Bacteriovoracaceae bacterium]|nr:serine protease [Bacteriovoracaceae bacterium]